MLFNLHLNKESHGKISHLQYELPISGYGYRQYYLTTYFPDILSEAQAKVLLTPFHLRPLS